jgi:parvulin-like peptidyl-prolyl isomerase|tara:strand:+ start:9041 stop:9841 length:801 start_codon:yes stop_codon:yes gene_type:complete
VSLRILVFFVIGLFIFILDIGFNSKQDSKDIYISDQELTSLLSAWQSQVGRPPSDEEIVNIINNFVQEEILYREALLLDLDQEDRIIKRRLAQKITFLKQETIPDDPSQEELEKFFEQNKNNYYVPATYSFSHHYFSKESSAKEKAARAFNDYQTNGTELKGDPFFLGKNFYQNSADEIKKNFGELFFLAIENLALNKWSGPHESAFGEHIILLKEVTAGFSPPLEKVLLRVQQDYLLQAQDKAITEYINKIRSQYRVIINPDYQF